MSLYILSSVLLVVFFLLVGYSVRSVLLDWRKLVFAIIAVLVFKAPLFIGPFFGLEYEDSFIFSVVARQLANNVFTKSYFTESIVLGSYTNPILHGTYSGHYILFSVFSSLIIRVVGYSANLLSYINMGISFLILLLLSDFGSYLKLKKEQWWIIPCVFLISPIINVFGSTQLSETFSSFLIISLIYFLLVFRSKPNIILGISVVISFTLSILVKRENNILILALIFFLFYDVLYLKGYKNNKAYLLYLLVIVVFGLLNLFIQDLSHSVNVESNEIGTAAFSMRYFRSIFPVFVKSLLSFKYFIVTGLLLFLSILFVVFRKSPPIILICAILLLGFLALYSIHYRSYYFIHYQSISEFETFRYLNNIYPLFVVVIGYVLSRVFSFSRITKLIVIAAVVSLSSLSFYHTIVLRKNFSEEEYNIRFKQPVGVLEYLGEKEENFVIFSSDALIYQILGSEELFVGDILDVVNTIDYVPDDFQIYLHSTPFLKSDHFRDRYPDIFTWIEKNHFDRILTLDNDSHLLRLRTEE